MTDVFASIYVVRSGLHAENAESMDGHGWTHAWMLNFANPFTSQRP